LLFIIFVFVGLLAVQPERKDCMCQSLTAMKESVLSPVLPSEKTVMVKIDYKIFINPVFKIFEDSNLAKRVLMFAIPPEHRKILELTF